MVYSTLRDIEAGEELCVSYGPHLWFQDADGQEEQLTLQQEDFLSQMDL